MGAYIGVVGLALFVAFAVMFFILFNVVDIMSVWICVFGVFCVMFGVYYVGMLLYEF